MHERVILRVMYSRPQAEMTSYAREKCSFELCTLADAKVGPLFSAVSVDRYPRRGEVRIQQPVRVAHLARRQ